MSKVSHQAGSSLIEIVAVIIIMGILSSLAMIKMGSQVDTARYEQTKAELDNLAHAMVGNPHLRSAGARTDFGYVGDVGSLPPNLAALVTNPGLTTWAGPYIDAGQNGLEYAQDGWSTNYIYTDTLIQSVGSGSNIDKLIAQNSASLLANSISGYLVDAGNNLPGTSFMDSVLVALTYPDGSGGYSTTSTSLSPSGNFTLTNIPIGNHTLLAIHLPTADSAAYPITVTPGSAIKLRLAHPSELW